MPALNDVPIPSDSFCVRELGEETIFLTEKGDQLHCLDAVGSFIWREMDGKQSLGDIVQAICAEYAVEQPTAEKDLLRFAAALAEKGIIRLEAGS